MAAIDKGVVLLTVNDELRRALAREPARTADAVEEMLRLPFPVPGASRPPPPSAQPGPETEVAGGLPRWAKADIEIVARTELQVLFATLLRRFPTLRLAVAAEDLRPLSHLLTGGLQSLPVTW